MIHTAAVVEVARVDDPEKQVCVSNAACAAMLPTCAATPRGGVVSGSDIPGSHPLLLSNSNLKLAFFYMVCRHTERGRLQKKGLLASGNLYGLRQIDWGPAASTRGDPRRPQDFSGG